MIRILLVEDDDQSVEAIKSIIFELSGDALLKVAKNRDDAINSIDSEFFDLMILDLAIPPDSSGDSPSPVYGQAVFGRSKDVAPGMPIFLLTGSSVEDFVETLLRRKESVDIWATGEVPTVDISKKLDLDQCSAKLSPFISGVHRLSEVELEKVGVDLTLAEDRILRIMVSWFGGARCQVKQLSGGLSGVRVLKLLVLNSHGAVLHHAVGKLGPISDIQEESRRYTAHVIQLAPAVTPRQLVMLKFGAKSTAGVFYGLAAGHDLNFFQALTWSGFPIESAVEETKNCLAAWARAAGQWMRTVGSVRERLLSASHADRLTAQYALTWLAEHERRNILVRWGCVHGDLHGGNVLLSDQGQPAIIDYGDIDHGSLCIDPLTLEFSALFHPDGPWKDGEWPTEDQARRWFDLDSYLVDCPNPIFVRACRAWAIEVSAGQRDVSAAASAYFLRQLKYPETNKNRAIALLDGALALYNST